MRPRFLTTGQAAKVCAVTPDTILKWIRAGRLPARRTAGGHHRIDRRDLERTMRAARTGPPQATPASLGRRRFRYCWEHQGTERLPHGCKDCLLYHLRALRCYELAPQVRNRKLFCDVTCEDCEYYQHTHDQPTNVLVVTDDDPLATALRADAHDASFNLELTDCAYSCSALVEDFRPDFAVVDCSLGPEFSCNIADRIAQDPRMPFVRIILAGTDGHSLDDCERMIFARIAQRFGIADLAECIAPPVATMA